MEAAIASGLDSQVQEWHFTSSISNSEACSEKGGGKMAALLDGKNSVPERGSQMVGGHGSWSHCMQPIPVTKQEMENIGSTALLIRQAHRNNHLKIV